MKLTVDNPNLSVILPTSCNAHCTFCYWKPQQGLTPQIFNTAIASLPKVFTQCSITGGEPTLCPDLNEYLRIARDSFTKVVLNTNGARLTTEIMKAVDFVNISRHHFNDELNYNVFGTRSVPSAAYLRELCNVGNVTLNCFLPDDFQDMDFVLRYIDFAKGMNAKVAFRKYFSNLKILDAVDKEDTLLRTSICQACLHRYHRINDVDVTFKYSVEEPFIYMGGIYELILNANGALTYDWDGQWSLSRRQMALLHEEAIPAPVEAKVHYVPPSTFVQDPMDEGFFSHGCGYGYRNSCG